MPRNLTLSIVIGLTVTLPFFILEAITTSGFARSGFPLFLFIYLLVSVTLFVFTVMSIVKSLSSKKKQKKDVKFFVFLVLKIVLAGYLAVSWIILLIDQWPCFLGASGC